MILPYFPLYVADYEADAMHLTLEEDGFYNRLLRLCWKSPGCSVPDDPKWIARRMFVSVDVFEAMREPVIDEYFKRSRGRLFNARLLEEFEKAVGKSAVRREAGARGGRAKALKDKGMDAGIAKAIAEALPKQSHAILEPEPEPEKKEAAPRATRFDDFWESFPHRNGKKVNRKGALRLYEAAVKRGVSEDRLISMARSYEHDEQVRAGFGRGPVPWLNQEGWGDVAVEGGASRRVTDADRAVYAAKFYKKTGGLSDAYNKPEIIAIICAEHGVDKAELKAKGYNIK